MKTFLVVFFVGIIAVTAPYVSGHALKAGGLWEGTGEFYEQEKPAERDHQEAVSSVDLPEIDGLLGALRNDTTEYFFRGIIRAIAKGAAKQLGKEVVKEIVSSARDEKDTDSGW